MSARTSRRTELIDYIRVLSRNRWTIVTAFCIVVVIAAVHAFTATPVYRATARLVIDREDPNVVSIPEVMAVDASGTDYYQTQYRIIESRTVARQVIRTLNLYDSEEFFPRVKQDPISRFIFHMEEIAHDIIDRIASLLNTPPPEGGEAAEPDAPDTELVTDFIKRVSVSPIRNSRLVDVSFEAKSPKLAADAANALAAAYINRNLETKLRAVQDAVKWLNTRIEDERKRVEAAEQALLRYKKEHGIVTDFSSDTEKITAQKLAQLNTQVVEAESRRVEAQTRFQQASALANRPDMLDSIPEVLGNELIQQINAMEIELYQRMSELSKKYGKKHPQMVAVESELKTIQEKKAAQIRQVINSLKNEYEVALARENSLKKALAEQKRESLELNQKAIAFTVLQREAESARQMYELLVRRFKETSLTEDMKTGNIRVIDRAEVPMDPVRPRKKLNILVAAVLGLMLGVGLSFFFEFLDNTVKTPEDVRRQVEIPYLGPVPAVPAQSGGNGAAPETVTQHDPQSTASEAYRGIRTGVLFSKAGKEPAVILVTSAGPAEGKTMTSCNLAITMAQSGGKALLIDADLRRPDCHRIFGMDRETGLTNVLVGRAKIEDVRVATDVPGLDVVACGPIPPNPSEMLGSERMAELIASLRKDYRRIVIDTPPVTAVTDALVLARSVDGAIFVMRAGSSAKNVSKEAVDQLKNAGIHIIGGVLNGVDTRRDGYAYYQYYSYRYGGAGEKGRGRRS